MSPSLTANRSAFARDLREPRQRKTFFVNLYEGEGLLRTARQKKTACKANANGLFFSLLVRIFLLCLGGKQGGAAWRRPGCSVFCSLMTDIPKSFPPPDRYLHFLTLHDILSVKWTIREKFSFFLPSFFAAPCYETILCDDASVRVIFPMLSNNIVCNDCAEVDLFSVLQIYLMPSVCVLAQIHETKF